MAKTFTVTLAKIMKELGLETVYMPENPEELLVSSCEVNRPGLALGGYFDYFDTDRIQILGRSEYGYLEDLDADTAAQRLGLLTSHKPPAIVITRGMEAFAGLKECCEQNQVPLLRSADTTSGFMAALIAFLNVELAPRVTRHGVFVEVYGEGILLAGDSGVGKSETAIELVKRGHRLIADDAVEIRRVSNKTLVGSAPDNIRHFIELRGIGIINARRIFGMGAVKVTEKIDMVIQLEPWVEGKFYDRLGLGEDSYTMLGVSLPYVTIPVRPGRTLAGIVEIATMKNRQMKYGENSALDFIEQFDRRVDAMVSQSRGSR